MNSKIILTAFIALLALSTVLVASASAEDFWSGLIEGIQEWFRISPFGGMFETPVKDVSLVNVIFYPENYTLAPTDRFDIESSHFSVSGFKGTVDFEPSTGYATFSHEDGVMKFKGYLSENITISKLKISRLTLGKIHLDITTGNSTWTTQDGMADFVDFVGDVRLFSDHIEMTGNVTKITKK
ncbi:MAG: hypothetical protein JW716_02980 [Candidatus Aenigmarchaeota archaeon]|nr:hypothetical protein [Candidatus Aenigmarchaeota archaeon]